MAFLGRFYMPERYGEEEEGLTTEEMETLKFKPKVTDACYHLMIRPSSGYPPATQFRSRATSASLGATEVPGRGAKY